MSCGRASFDEWGAESRLSGRRERSEPPARGSSSFPEDSLAAKLSRIPRALLRAVRHRTPVRWLERIHLVCNGLVFMFHEVHDNSMRGLRTGCTVGCLKSVIMQLRNEGWDIVSLDDVMSRLRDGDPSRRFAVLTFDDGYRDLLTRALPVLEHHDVPFTVFVPTGAPTRELHSWWLGVRALFERRDEVAIASMGTVFTCGDIESKMKGYQEVSKWIHQDYRRAPLLTETFRKYKISLTSLNDCAFHERSRIARRGASSVGHGGRAYDIPRRALHLGRRSCSPRNVG